jgi:hypothetical protein
MKFELDTGEIRKVYYSVIDEYFPFLQCLNFLFVVRDKERFSEGQLVIADTTKLSNRDRDLFGFDVRIETDINYWSKTTNQSKIAYHELCHIEVELEDDETPKIKDDRVVFHITPHDLCLKRFISELKLYGLTKDEEKIYRILRKIRKKHGSENTTKKEKSAKKSKKV